MKNFSNTRPDTFVDVGFGFNFNYEIEACKDVNNNESYSYNTVLVKTRKKEDLIKALIHSMYSIDDEIALVNNFNAGLNIAEYEEYQAYRAYVKQLANESVQ